VGTSGNVTDEMIAEYIRSLHRAASYD